MAKQHTISLNLGQKQFSAGDQASIFKLPFNASHVQTTARIGEDLLIKLDDGTIITIKHYFKHGANFNHLAFSSEPLSHQVSSAEQDAIIEPAATNTQEHHQKPGAWMLGLGAVLLGGVAAVAFSGDGGGSSSASAGPLPPAPTINTASNTNGTITVSGTGQPGSTVNVTYPDGTKGSTVIPSSGLFTITSPTPQTSGSVHASVTNPSGQVSPVATQPFVDHSAPAAPTATTTANPNGTITVAGTAEPGSTIKVTYPDGTTGSTVVPASGQYAITSPTPQTSGSVTTTATDRAGNTSTSTSTPFVDHTAPAAPTATTTANPNGTITVSGTAEPGSTIKTTFPDGTTATSVVPASGQYSITSPTPQTSGPVSTTATDPAGNTSTSTATPFVDHTAPTAPTATPTANPNGTITVAGTAEPGSTVKTKFPDGTTGTTVVPANGQYSITSATPQPSGPISTTATDPAGNVSPVTTTPVTDQTPPVAPTSATTANPNGTLTVAGTAEPGSTVKVTFPDGTTGTAVVPANGQYSITSPTPQTSGPVSAIATDPAGNASPATTSAFTDATPPLAPTSTTTANPNGTLTVAGTAEPGSTVKVTFPDGTTGTAVVPANGQYSVTSATPQTSGPVSASVTDPAGNTSPATPSAFTDTAAPLAPTMSSAANPNGTLTVSGTAEPGSTVKVTFPDGTTATVPVAPNGTYSATSATPQGSGPVSAVAKDAAGNASPAASSNVTDTTPPTAPTITPTSNPNGTVTVVGTAEPGSSVKVTFPDGSIATAVVPPNGSYSLTSASPQSSGPIKATATDPAGNISTAATSPFLDTTAPTAPTLSTTGNPNGTITASGTGEPGSTVKVTFPDGTTASTTIPANGNFSVTSPTQQASGPVTATVTDPAGNVSTATITPYTDVTPPAAPSLVITPNANGTITASGTGEPGSTAKVTFPDGTTGTTIVPANGQFAITSATPQGSGPVTAKLTDPAGNASPTSNATYGDATPPASPTAATSANPDGTIAVSGTAEPGSTVKVTFPDGSTASTTVPANGAYTVTSATPQSSGPIKTTATDAAGNASPATTTAFTDTIAPAAPTASIAANPNGTLTVSGTGEPGSTVTVKFPDGTTANVPVAANGTYTATSAAPQSSGVVTVTDKDAAGNTSTPTTTTYNDTIAPTAPTLVTTVNPNGTVNATGTAEPGSTVKITYPDGTTSNIVVPANGTYAATSATPQPSGNVTAVDKDAAGNLSPTTTVPYTDNSAPAAPSATTAVNPNGTLTVSGTGEPGSTATITFPDGSTATVPVAANGTYSATSATPQTSGPVSVVNTDTAGNASPATTSSYADTTAPAAPTSNVTSNPNGTLTVSGTGEPGSSVKVTFPDGTSASAPVAANGTYTATSAAAQPSGTVSVVDKDAAGNTSPATTTSYTDTTAPAAPTATTTANPNGTLTVSGTGEPGSTVTVTFPDGTTANAPVAANGTFTATSAKPQSSGVVSVTDKDAAGNVSPATNLTYTDTTAPTAPTLVTTANPDGTLKVSGTAEPGSTVKVTYPDGTTASVLVPASGIYTATSTTPQTTGTVSAATKDAAGNTSPPATSNYTDTTAPAAPTATTTGNPNGTLTVSGTGELGSSAKVTFPDGTTTTVPVAANGTYNATSATPQTSGTVAVVNTDAAGNASATTTKTFTDSTAPTAPTVTTSANANGTLTVSGTGEPGSTATVTFPDGTTATVPVAANGTYTATSAAAQPSGTVSVTDKDAAGNSSPATSATYSDTTPPPTPTATTTANPNGTLTVSGTGEPGSTVTVTFPDGSTASVPVAANGIYSATSATPQSSGTVSVTDKDAAGNTSSPATSTYVDNTAPLAPSAVPTANPNGTLTVSGTGEPGSTVKVTFPDGTTATVPVGANGTYTATSSTPQGSGPVTAKATDAAGNASSTTTSNFADTAAPLAPTLTTTANPNGTITASGAAEPGTTVTVTFPDGSTINAPVAANGTYSATSANPQNSGSVTAIDKDAAGNLSPVTSGTYTDTTAPSAPTATTTANPNGTLTVSGTAEPGSTVKVIFPDGTSANVPVAANGTYTATSAAPQTSGTISVTDKDAAGNTSPATTSTYSDTTPPTTPTLATSANPNGTLTVSGTAEPGSTITVTFPDGTTAQVPVAANGTYSATSATPQGSGPVSVVDKDAAGNTSPAVTASYTDSTPPLAPSLTTTANPNGSVTASGTAEPGTTVKVTFPDGSFVNAPVLANGTFSATSATPQTSGTVTATDKDAAGNTSPATTANFVDTTAPTAPTVTTTGNANGTLTVSGTGEPGTQAIVTFPDGTTATVLVAANGSYSATSTGPQASGTVSVVDKDAAGNSSPATAAVYSDTTPPAAPTLTAVPNANGTVTVSGTGEPGSTVTVTYPDGSSTSAVVAANGTYTTTSATPQPAGTISAVDKDLSGNNSPSATNSYTPPTPATPAISTVADNVGPVQGNLASGAATDDSTPTLSGLGTTGDTIKIYDGATLVGTATVDNTGHWTATTSVLSNGAHTLNVTATSPAGVVSASASTTLTVDNQAPTAPVITHIVDDVAPVLGDVANNGVTNDANLVVQGTAEANSTIQVYEGATLLGTTTADGTGAWTFNAPSLSDGAHQLTVKAVDAAGNTSASALSNTFTIDTTAPAITPTILSGTDDKALITGTFVAGAKTNDAKPLYTGSLSAALGAGEVLSITVKDGANVLHTYRSDIDTAILSIVGTAFTLDLNGQTALADGAVTLAASVSDLAGNVGTVGNFAYTQDTVAPTAPAFTSSVNGGGQGVLTGTAEPNAKVEVYLAGHTTPDFTTTADASGNWTYVAPLGTSTGGTVTAVATDQAGNVSPTNTQAAQFYIPFTPPAAVTTLSAATSYAEAGYSVSKIGDFNGDGIDDFVIGAPASEAGHIVANTSHQYILYGNVNGVPTVSLDSLNASQGIKINNTTWTLPNSEFRLTGQTVTNLGDINGDGYADVGISSNANDRAYVLFGRGGNSTSAIELGSIDASNNGQATADGFVLVNAYTGAWWGSSMSGGDINGDGYGDIVVGSLDGGGNGQGQATVYYGHAGLGGTSAWQNLYASYDGLRYINAGAAVGSILNYTLAGTLNTTYNAGGGTFDGDADLGARVSVIADVNGDGFNDYIVTAPRADQAGVWDTGTAYLIFGSATGLAQFDLNNLTPSKGVRLVGSEFGEQLGGSYQTGTTTTQGISNLNGAFTAQQNSIANIGDINGDGIADFAVGSAGWGNQQLDPNGPGRVYVVYGKATGVNWAGLSLGALDGTNGFILNKASGGTSSNTNTSVNQLGWSVAGGSDLNGDGLDDLVVSAPGEAAGGNKDTGAVYIVYGKSGGTTAFTSLNDLDAMVTAGTAKKLTGTAAYQYFGSSVATADVNGDGIGDVIVGAAGVNTSAGATYITYGQTTGFTQIGSVGNDELLAGATTSGGSAIVGGVDRIDGGTGNDVIHSVGSASDTGNAGLFDVAYGASGNDTIGIVGMNFTRVAGGQGLDTLKVEGAAPLSINLSALAVKVEGFESFDLSNTGSTITVGANDVLHQKSIVTSDFLIKGGANDHVTLTNGANAQWNDTGVTKTVNGVVYEIYHNTAFSADNKNADVLVQQGMHVDLTPAAQIVQTAVATKQYAYSGYEVANVGDFNGDGITDYVVSAPANELGHEQVYGSKQYVVYGTANGVPQVNLDNLTAAQGIVLSTTNMKFGSIDIGTTGSSIAAVGDVNGDGFADFAMSSNRGDSAFVIFGRGGNATNAIDLATVSASNNGNATADGFLIANYNTGGWMGTGISGGDINGDGYGDILVGSSDGGGNGNGQYMVLYGHAGAAGTTAWQNLYAAADGLHNINNFALIGSLLSTTAAQTTFTTEFTANNYAIDGDLGDRIAVVGDVNGDGFNDYIVTAPRTDHNGVIDTGTAYLMFGSAAGLGSFDLKNITAAQGIKLFGAEVGESLGGTTLGTIAAGGVTSQANVAYGQSHSVANIGDINGDGIDDFAIGSPGWGNQGFYDAGPGRTYVVFGQASGVTWSDASLASLNGTTGFVLSKASAGTSSAGNTNNNQLGWSIAGGGDFNGDGIDDMVVSAVGESVSGNVAAGAAYVVFGQAGANATSTFTSSTDLDALVTANKAVKFTGTAANDHFGASVTMGDFNGDGLADVMVGAPGSSAGGVDAGQTYVYYGSQANLTQAATIAGDTLAAGGHATGYAAVVGGVDRISGGIGNDTITGIGNAADTGNNGTFDTAYGGAGNDRLEIVGMNFTRVDGGLGNDTLALTGANLSLNLATAGDKVQGFESFELGNQTNTLTLRLADVVQMSESLTGTTHVSVSGGATDTLDLVGATWTNSGTTSVINGNTYDLWSSSLLPAAIHKDDVWVQQGVVVV